MKKRFFLISAILLIFTCVALNLGVVTKSALAETLNDFSCTVSAPEDGTYTFYTVKAIDEYNQVEATEAKIPNGYTDNVIVLTGESGTIGVVLDFSQGKYLKELIQSITIRFYINEDVEGSPSLRIPKQNATSNFWVNKTVEYGSWQEVTISNLLDEWFDDYGYLNKFALCFRRSSPIVYLDNIVVNMKTDDGVAPVISYEGTDTITAYKGTLFAVSGMTAYDEQEQREIDLEYIWGEGTQLDEDGLPSVGIYSLIVRATDNFGNYSEYNLTVKVAEPDFQNPVISTNITTMSVCEGTIPKFGIEATDNSGSVTITEIWSAGALDSKGKLTLGEHTYTFIATDPSGNSTTLTIKVKVVAVVDYGDKEIIDEEQLTVYTLYFDLNGLAGEIEPLTVNYGQAILGLKKLEMAGCEFLGWKVGDDLIKDGDIWLYTTNQTAVAQWGVEEYTISYQLNGGENVEQNPNSYTSTTEIITLMPAKDRIGYTFKGWYSSEFFFKDTLVEEIKQGSSGNLTLYAKWELVEYSITYELNGGKNSNNNPNKYYIISSTFSFENPTKEGYVFDGWYSNAEYHGEKITTVEKGSNGNLTLYAKWKEESDLPNDKNNELNNSTSGCGGTMSPVGVVIVCGIVIGVNIFQKRKSKKENYE